MDRKKSKYVKEVNTLEFKETIIKQIKNISNVQNLNVDAGQREVYKAEHSFHKNMR